MKWDQIEIIDIKDKSYKGNEAKKFVDIFCPNAPIRTYKKGKISVEYKGSKSVNPDIIKLLLIELLVDKIKTLKVKISGQVSSKTFVPKKATVNPINKVAQYNLTLELGDIDALFDPIASDTEPWKQKGVQQRLQVLGYLYTPLEHPGNKSPDFHHAKTCWEYYKVRVHKSGSDAEAVVKLKKEIEGNLIAGSFPKSGEILAKSTLPKVGEFVAIRFPGGYCTTKSPVTNLRGGDHFFNKSVLSVVPSKYDFRIGDKRNDIENCMAEDNPLLGQLPFIAKVKAHWSDGSITEPADVPVLFRLMMPEDATNSLFAPSSPPDKVMNYDKSGVYWESSNYPAERDVHQGVNEEEWKGLHRLTKAAYAQDPINANTIADGWIDTWSTRVLPWSAVEDWWEDQTVTPYQILDAPLENLLIALDSIVKKPDPLKAGKGFAANNRAIHKDEWTQLCKLVAKAKTEKLGNESEATALSIIWINKWKTASSVTWDAIKDWWSDVAETPYPTLRSNMVSNAKQAVKILLEERKKAEGRETEIPNIGQRKYINDLLATSLASADASDPQKKNAPNADYGGKLGLGIEAVLDKPTAQQPGFHTKRSTQESDYGVLKLATLPGDTAMNPYAMECKTNDKGFSGVIFKPARCGGDSYKIYAYIDPEWLKRKRASIGDHSKAETGTFVVWRNIRINRYIQMKNPIVPFSQKLEETLKTGRHNPNNNPAQANMCLDTQVLDLSLLPGASTEARSYTAVQLDQVKANPIRYRPVQVSPTPFEEQLKWAYCELIAETGIEILSEDEQKAATALGIEAIKTFWKGKAVEWDKLQYHDATSPFLCNFLSIEQYNRDKLAGSPALDDGADSGAFEKGLQWLYEAMMEYFAGGGVLPGLTIVQIPRGDTWDLNACDVKTTVTSGYGTGARGFYLSHTEGVYHGVFQIYPSTSNAIHEIGHVFSLAHQPPAGAELEDAHQTPIKTPYTKPSDDQCVCVMSYSGCYGDLCGKCLMSLRGWAQTHTNTLYG